MSRQSAADGGPLTQSGNMPPVQPQSPPVTPLPSSDAINNPRLTRRGAYDVREEPEYQPPTLEIPVYGDLMPRVAEEIVIADEEAIKREYADRLAFDRELLTIQLEAPNEDNAPQHVPVGVNGRFYYLPVGREIRLPRCFVEVLAAAQPHSVQTKVRETPGEDPINLLTRNSRMRYPFTILHDPSPGPGRLWLRRVKQMG